MVKSTALVSPIKKLQSYMKKRSVDVSILFNVNEQCIDGNSFYLSGTEGMGILVSSKSSAYYVVPEMEYEKVKSQVKPGVKLQVLKQDTLKKLFTRFCRGKEKIILGVDTEKMTLARLDRLKKLCKFKHVDIGQYVQNTRMQKTPEEVKNIRKACQITDKIFDGIVSGLREKRFRTDSDIASFIISESYRFGCKPSFEPIVAPGKNGALAHYVPSGKKLIKGFMVLDFGVKYNGYCSDMSRTLYLGKPTKKEVQDYELVLEIQKTILSNALAGAAIRDLDAYSRKQLGNYPHSLGHGLGIDVHELPGVSPKAKLKVIPGMVLAIEPGMYKPGKYGIRIEDDVYVTEKSNEILNKSSKSLIAIAKWA